MNLIASLRGHLRRLVVAWLDRRNPERGAEMLDDMLELYLERRAAHGQLRASMRGAWDLITLSVRPRQPRKLTSSVRRSQHVARIFDDLKQAVKGTVRRPAVSVTVVSALTLGIGLAILTYTLVAGVLLRPLSFPRSEELLSLFSEFREESGYTFARFALSAPEISDYQKQSRTVDVAAWEPGSAAITLNDGISEPFAAVRASSGVFRLLETPPALGRVLTPADDIDGAPCAAILSDGLWKEKFLAAPDVVGRTVRISGNPCEIVGVMPSRFAFPNETVRMWLPFALDSDPDTRGNHGLFALGRLRSGVTLQAALVELQTIMTAWAREYSHHRGHGVVITPLKNDVVGPISQQLVVLASAVVLVLLVISANVSSLMLAHGEARRKELAVRAALGASRASLVRQLVIEALLVSIVGGAAGAALAWFALDPLLAAYPQRLPRASEIVFDARVIAAAGTTSLIIGLIVGLLPAIRLTRLHLSDSLKSGERGEGLSLSLRTQGWLVITELALAVSVTTGAILLAQSFSNLQQVPLGFDAASVTVAAVSLPNRPPANVSNRPDGARAEAGVFFGSLIDRLSELPHVAEAGAISNLPLVGSPPPDDFTIDGRPVARPGEPGFNAHYIQVTPGALEALHVRLRRGRSISSTDVAGAQGVAVINEASARTFWPDTDPIGKRVRYATGVANGEWSGWGPWLTIVGVVADVRFTHPVTPATPAIYVAHAQMPREAYDGRFMFVAIRTTRGQTDLAADLRAIAASLNPGASVSRIRTMDAVVGGVMARPRFMSWLMTLFAAVSLMVASLGVYAVVAYGVQRRSREIGVRMALGATRQRILWLIATQTFAMTAIGLFAGLAGAAWLSRSMRSLLFGVGSFDVRTYALVTVVFIFAVLAALLIPARRAMAVDPLIALRAD